MFNTRTLVLSSIAAILIIMFAPVAWMLLNKPAQTLETEQALPWRITTTMDGGSSVFGLTFGESTLGDAKKLYGGGEELAVVAPPDGTPLLEIYFDTIKAGYINGKLVVTAQLDEAAVLAMLERATKAKYMQSTTRKLTLSKADQAAALAVPIGAITFIPSASLDEQMVLQRFGQPASRIRQSEKTEHFLYPDKGLDLALNDGNKEILQYVAPRDFERLQAPLMTLLAQPEAGTEAQP